MQGYLLVLSFSLCCILSQNSTSAKILKLCEAAREIKRSPIANTWVNSFACLMNSESHFNTTKVTGPGYKSSYSHGILQINSYEWCNRYRPGGFCNKKCDAYLDDDIQDDLLCAKLIFEKVGFKHWKSFEQSCKNPNKLPDTSKCFKKDATDDEDIEEEVASDSEEPEYSQDAHVEDRMFLSGVKEEKKNDLLTFINSLKNFKHYFQH